MQDPNAEQPDVTPGPTEPAPAPVRPADYVWPAKTVRQHLTVHVTFLVMAVVVITMSFLMRSEGPNNVFLPGSIVPMPESCYSKRLMGIDCPGCGLTRAFISISHGEFSRAWRFNSASFIVYLFCLVQIPWNTMQIYLLWTRKRALELNYVFYAPILMVIVLGLHWLWKISFQLATM
ncbi:MAG: DUF2752 domain-containing protein [Planctomycetota bacterium]